MKASPKWGVHPVRIGVSSYGKIFRRERKNGHEKVTQLVTKVKYKYVYGTDLTVLMPGDIIGHWRRLPTDEAERLASDHDSLLVFFFNSLAQTYISSQVHRK